MAGTKLVQAKAAAATFIDLLALPADQAAVVGFSSTADVRQTLTGDRAVLLAAIEGLASRSGTRIDRALSAAVLEILSPRRSPGNRAAIVLLSDGAQREGTEQVLAEAARARSVGATVYAIGLGEAADHHLLQRLAGPDRYYYAAGGDELAQIYRDIAVRLPCR
jgi:Mg-chelatase subunit ChlD